MATSGDLDLATSGDLDLATSGYFFMATDNKCHDCATPPGALHHPGCDGERCRCGQMLSCSSGCAVDECEREDGHHYVDGSCRWCGQPFGRLRVASGR